jgi:hypothetical protein
MTRVTLATVLSAVLFVALVPMFTEAHHSDVMFEEKKEITVQGVVKEFQFTNPHSCCLWM